MANNWKITNDNKAKLAALLDQPPKIAYWELAQVIGKHENTISKWMRCPNDEQTEIIMDAIKQIREDQ